MKPALVFVFGALGLLAFAKYQRSEARTQPARRPREATRRPRARRLRFRHRDANGLLDLNSATLSELKSLGGIDDETIGRIIDNRPYMTKLDLIGRRVVPDAMYELIKHAITAVHAA